MSKRNRNTLERITYASLAFGAGAVSVTSPLVYEMPPLAGVGAFTAGLGLMYGASHLMPTKKRTTGVTARMRHTVQAVGYTTKDVVSWLKREEPEPIVVPAEVRRSVESIGEEWLGNSFLRQVPASVMRRWLISAERYEHIYSRGSGLSANRWKRGMYWDRDHRPAWWSEAYYETCLNLLHYSENFHRICLVETYNNQQARLRLSANDTYAYVWLADRELSVKKTVRSIAE